MKKPNRATSAHYASFQVASTAKATRLEQEGTGDRRSGMTAGLSQILVSGQVVLSDPAVFGLRSQVEVIYLDVISRRTTPHGHLIRNAVEMEHIECPYPPDDDLAE